MKVLNLQCAHQHEFEGWFASEDDYASQLARGLLSCPMCGDEHVEKKLSAPRLNLRTGRGDETAASGGTVALSNHATNPELAALQARMLQALREVMANTEDVGDRFAAEARAMHHGETEHRQIRGQASAREALELLEEGIDVVPLPMIPATKETLQ
ncbi:DUF1178 family protein [Hydrogenophaga sp.]|uniref:DUF1178 family protein n=1 Tax=Hydrogenophaga sp. TaxID=1904254 RepID=UPI002603DB2F|nr:DUF1178 family protein [Hydrogenophaga sp.]MCW5653560.1 DUF1178 family protein [Hydrogenophaga sp.]